MVRRILRLAGLLAAIAVVAGLLMIRMAPDDAEQWHADPATASRTGRPNDYLVAPPGTTKAPLDRGLRSVAGSPDEVLARFDTVARAAPRVTVIAGSVEQGHITYMQRTAIIGFPDYISVRAVETPDGAGLIVWSRSRYGYSDMGVNRDRVERWLAAAGLS